MIRFIKAESNLSSFQLNRIVFSEPLMEIAMDKKGQFVREGVFTEVEKITWNNYVKCYNKNNNTYVKQ